MIPATSEPREYEQDEHHHEQAQRGDAQVSEDAAVVGPRPGP